MNEINVDNLLKAISVLLKSHITKTDFTAKQLQGGTLGDVQLISGTATTSQGNNLPFSLVLKKQSRWERPGDPNSWRREHDLYSFDFPQILRDITMPKCYYAEFTDSHTQLYMEYIHGISGGSLTLDMLEQVAEKLGRLQGMLYHKTDLLANIPNLSDTGFLKREHDQWHAQVFEYQYLCSDECPIPNHVREMLQRNDWDNQKTIEYNYLRSTECDLPSHLKEMLIEIDDGREAVFGEFSRLPIVFCHRDLWIENIFVSEDNITLIDWDGAGFGYLGEDIASLIIDDTNNDNLMQYYKRLIVAYRKGISGYIDIPSNLEEVIWKMMLIKFGYRILQGYMFTTVAEDKSEQAEKLQRLFEMRI